ncbi:MAG TPA: hypothetical protein VF756_21625 [Thermoanaerobaculia bacterium]
MGIEHLAAVLDHSRKGGSHLVILLVVASYSDQRGEWIADQATLQRRARLGRRRVQQLLDELVAEGELAVIPGEGRGKKSTYRLLVGTPAPEKAQPSAPFSEKGEAQCAFSGPPCPPFPPDPLIPLNPPEKQKQEETCGLRPLSGPQSATFRVNLLLEEAGVPLPSPAQIGLWAKTIGGIEPLLDLLRRLIQAGLAIKKNPSAYIHRVVQERAERPEPAKPLTARAGRDLLWSAGADEVRRQQALQIIAKARGEK